MKKSKNSLLLLAWVLLPRQYSWGWSGGGFHNPPIQGSCLSLLTKFKTQNPGVGGKVPPPDPTPLLKKKTTFSRVAEGFFNQKNLKKCEKYWVF